MKGVGRIYQQTFVDTYARVAICKLYTEKTAIAAADLLNDRVIPCFAEHRIGLLRVLTDHRASHPTPAEAVPPAAPRRWFKQARRR